MALPPSVDLTTLRRGRLHETPFRWAKGDGLLDEEAVQLLASSLPEEGFRQDERRHGDKPYRLRARVLTARGAPGPATEDVLSPAWVTFVQSLLAPSYREAVSDLTGVDLDASPLEITAWRYDADCWLAPHVDKEDKLLTHVLYLTPSWERGWGGTLLILNSADIDDVADTVEPLAGRSVVIVRSPRSWHAVSPVTAAAGSAARLSVTATFLVHT